MSHDKLKKALARARQEDHDRLLAGNAVDEAAKKTIPVTAIDNHESLPPLRQPVIQSEGEDEPSPEAPPATTRTVNDKPGATQTRIAEINHSSLEKYKIIYDCRLNPAADQVKILRTQLLQRLLPGGGNSVLITSPKPGEGKTVNAISLAISLAQEIERTVLLIDANLRNPTVTDYFGLPQEKGLSDYLLGKVSIPEILINPGIDKLTLLPGGRPLTTSSEFIGASRMAELVKEMKERYPERILVFDGPDILTAADSLLFSKFVDGIVLVVEAEATTRNDVKLAIDRIGKEHLIGTILNKARE